MSDMTDPPFDLSCADDRAALAAALLRLGIPSLLRPSTPWPLVCVPLVTQSAAEAFDIEVFEEDCPALVGVSGYRPDPDPEAEGDPIDAYSTDYYGEYTLGNTAAQVERLWGEREKLIAAFHAGHFDDGGLMEEVLTEEVLTGEGLTNPRIYSLRKGAKPPPLGAVYVGRGTPWGNAYPMLNPSRVERDRVCDLFERDAVLRARNEPEWLEPLRGKSLTCWCKPTPESSVRCHAETLLRLANQGA